MGPGDAHGRGLRLGVHLGVAAQAGDGLRPVRAGPPPARCTLLTPAALARSRGWPRPGRRRRRRGARCLGVLAEGGQQEGPAPWCPCGRWPAAPRRRGRRAGGPSPPAPPGGASGGGCPAPRRARSGRRAPPPPPAPGGSGDWRWVMEFIRRRVSWRTLRRASASISSRERCHGLLLGGAQHGGAVAAAPAPARPLPPGAGSRARC